MAGLSCREVERRLQAELDDVVARSLPLTDADDLREHATGCAECQGLVRGFEAIRQGLRHLPAIEPPAGLADRTFAAWERAPRTGGSGGWWLATAAALALAISPAFVNWKGLGQRRAPKTPLIEVAVVGPPTNAPGEALVGVAATTWELAQAASGPSARAGRRLMMGATLPSLGPIVSGPERPTAPALEGAAERLERRTRPLSGSVRQAFRFLVPGGGPP